MTLNIKLDKYTLIEEIGRGGYGTVYRARDEALQVERAVKVLHPALVADPAFIDRFREEARLVARLKHPHIVPVYDLGEDQGRIYLAMEYLPGGSLKDLLAQEDALPYERALAVLRQIAAALDYAHSLNLIHRDIKPGNILFDADGNTYLTDFGFAKSLASADSSTTMTMTGGILGTPAYMAPEAWDGKGWTPAADVYSLACVFFEILLGRPLFDGDTPTRLMKQHIIEGPQFPDVWPDGVPAEISPVMGKALAQEIKNRYKTTLSFASALDIQELEPLPIAEPEEPVEEQTPKRVQHTPTKSPPLWQLWGLWAAISAVVLMLVFAQRFKSEPPEVVVETVLVTAQAQVVDTPTQVPPISESTHTKTPTQTRTITKTVTSTPTPTVFLTKTATIAVTNTVVSTVTSSPCVDISGDWEGYSITTYGDSPSKCKKGVEFSLSQTGCDVFGTYSSSECDNNAWGSWASGGTIDGQIEDNWFSFTIRNSNSEKTYLQILDNVLGGTNVSGGFTTKFYVSKMDD